MKQIFVDLDLTLADLPTHYRNVFGIQLDMQMYQTPPYRENIDWELIRNSKDFFLGIPPMPDMHELWSYVSTFNPIILTGVPRSTTRIIEAESNKREWVKKHLGHHVEVRCCQAIDKYKHCKEEGMILIDDWDRYKDKWESKGGIFIHHINAVTTIKQLQQIQLLELDRVKKRY